MTTNYTIEIIDGGVLFTWDMQLTGNSADQIHLGNRIDVSRFSKVLIDEFGTTGNHSIDQHSENDPVNGGIGDAPVELISQSGGNSYKRLKLDACLAWVRPRVEHTGTGTHTFKFYCYF